MKKIIIALAIIASCFLIYKFLFESEKTEAVKYVAVEAEINSVSEIIDTTGEVAALNRVEIKPSVAGRVDRLLANEGDVVKKGQVLAYLSSSDRVAILDAVRANENEKLSDWQNTYKATPIISPMNGKIILRNVVEGQTIATTDILFALADELIVLASVDESDISKVKIGQKAVVRLDSYQDIAVNGDVFQILEEGKNVNNVITYYVKIRPEQTPDFFKSLMTANIEITVKQQENTVVVPWNSVYETKDGESYVLTGNNNVQTKVPITAGIVDGDYVEVVSGLKAGDKILIKEQFYKLEGASQSNKGFLQMTRTRRKSNAEILSGSPETSPKQ